MQRYWLICWLYAQKLRSTLKKYIQKETMPFLQLQLLHMPNTFGGRKKPIIRSNSNSFLTDTCPADSSFAGACLIKSWHHEKWLTALSYWQAGLSSAVSNLGLRHLQQEISGEVSVQPFYCMMAGLDWAFSANSKKLMSFVSHFDVASTIGIINYSSIEDLWAPVIFSPCPLMMGEDQASSLKPQPTIRRTSNASNQTFPPLAYKSAPPQSARQIGPKRHELGIQLLSPEVPTTNISHTVHPSNPMIWKGCMQQKSGTHHSHRVDWTITVHCTIYYIIGKTEGHVVRHNCCIR